MAEKPKQKQKTQSLCYILDKFAFEKTMTVTIEIIHQPYRTVNIYFGPNYLLQHMGAEGNLCSKSYPFSLSLPWDIKYKASLAMKAFNNLGNRSMKWTFSSNCLL